MPSKKGHHSGRNNSTPSYRYTGINKLASHGDPDLPVNGRVKTPRHVWATAAKHKRSYETALGWRAQRLAKEQEARDGSEIDEDIFSIDGLSILASTSPIITNSKENDDDGKEKQEELIASTNETGGKAEISTADQTNKPATISSTASSGNAALPEKSIGDRTTRGIAEAGKLSCLVLDQAPQDALDASDDVGVAVKDDDELDVQAHNHMGNDDIGSASKSSTVDLKPATIPIFNMSAQEQYRRQYADFKKHNEAIIDAFTSILDRDLRPKHAHKDDGGEAVRASQSWREATKSWIAECKKRCAEITNASTKEALNKITERQSEAINAIALHVNNATRQVSSFTEMLQSFAACQNLHSSTSRLPVQAERISSDPTAIVLPANPSTAPLDAACVERLIDQKVATALQVHKAEADSQLAITFQQYDPMRQEAFDKYMQVNSHRFKLQAEAFETRLADVKAASEEKVANLEREVRVLRHDVLDVSCELLEARQTREKSEKANKALSERLDELKDKMSYSFLSTVVAFGGLRDQFRHSPAGHSTYADFESELQQHREWLIRRREQHSTGQAVSEAVDKASHKHTSTIDKAVPVKQQVIQVEFTENSHVEEEQEEVITEENGFQDDDDYITHGLECVSDYYSVSFSGSDRICKTIESIPGSRDETEDIPATDPSDLTNMFAYNAAFPSPSSISTTESGWTSDELLDENIACDHVATKLEVSYHNCNTMETSFRTDTPASPSWLGASTSMQKVNISPRLFPIQKDPANQIRPAKIVPPIAPFTSVVSPQSPKPTHPFITAMKATPPDGPFIITPASRFPYTSIKPTGKARKYHKIV